MEFISTNGLKTILNLLKAKLSVTNIPGTDDVDVNTMIVPGMYLINSPGSSGALRNGLPGTCTNGILIVIRYPSGLTVRQIWFRHGTMNTNDFQTFTRMIFLTNTGDVKTAGNWSRYIVEDDVSTSIGSNVNPVYINSYCRVTPCKFKLEKSVPSDAKFTDTTYTPANVTPKMNGTASVGSSVKYAREDHVHPVDTSRAAANHTHTNYASSNHTHSGYAGSSHTHNYLPLSGGILQGHLNVNTDNTWIFGGYNTNILNVYTRNIEAITGELFLKSAVGLNLVAPNHISCLPYSGSSGHIPIYARAFNAVSSKNVKENICNMTDDEAYKLLNVNIITFDYKEIAGGYKNQRGVIAEDVIDIIPSVVTIPDNYDENNEDASIPPSVDYSKFVPYLIKMVQIQQKEIDELRNRVSKLEENQRI